MIPYMDPQGLCVWILKGDKYYHSVGQKDLKRLLWEGGEANPLDNLS